MYIHDTRVLNFTQRNCVDFYGLFLILDHRYLSSGVLLLLKSSVIRSPYRCVNTSLVVVCWADYSTVSPICMLCGIICVTVHHCTSMTV